MAEYKIHNRMTHWQKSYPTWISFAAIALLLAVWEIVCSSGLISSLFLPAPSAILAALGKLITGGEISRSLAASLYRILLGFALGSIIGLLVGLVTGTSALMDRIGTPIVNALYPIPKIALLPLFILWLGIGELSKVTIIALGVFFPVAMNTYSGVKNVDTLLIKVAVSFNASWWLTMKGVVLPSALPVIFAGLRLAAGTSLLLLVAAEAEPETKRVEPEAEIALLPAVLAVALVVSLLVAALIITLLAVAVTAAGLSAHLGAGVALGDGVVSCLHLFEVLFGGGVVGVQVGVPALALGTVGFLYLVVGCAALDAQHLIGISHGSTSSRLSGHARPFRSIQYYSLQDSACKIKTKSAFWAELVTFLGPLWPVCSCI